MTGRKRTKSSRVEITGRKKERTEAERVAAKLEDDLREGRYKKRSRTTWAELRDQYEQQGLKTHAASTLELAVIAFDAVEQILAPRLARELTTEAVTRWTSALLDKGLAPATVAIRCRTLRAALNWAKDQELIVTVPKIKEPKSAKGDRLMKGRPLVGEEHDRMVLAVEAASNTLGNSPQSRELADTKNV
jgi:hypothetical protein